MTSNTKRGTRGFILPSASLLGNPGENELLPETVAELQRLGLWPREVAVDGGFQTPERSTRTSSKDKNPKAKPTSSYFPRRPGPALPRAFIRGK